MHKFLHDIIILGSDGSTATIQGAGQSTLNLKTTTNSKNNYIVGTTNGSLSFRPNGTQALTLDSSQNATFAGTISSGAITSTSNIITGGFFQTASSTIVKKYVSSWNSGVQTHDIIYNGWYSNTGDYTYLKAAGNSTGGHGIILAADNGTYLGTTDIETGGVTDSATAPLTNTWAYFRNATAYIKGDTTFAGILDVNGTGTSTFAGPISIGPPSSTGWQGLTITGSGTSYTQGAIILKSSTTDTPEARGQGIFMFNEGDDSTWYTGTQYQDADTWMVGRKAGTSLATSAATSAQAFLEISNSGNATFAGRIEGNDLRLRKSASDQTNSADTTTVPSTSSCAEYLRIESVYTDGKYTHEWTKVDRGGNLPLYLRQSKGTANSFTNLARFGDHTNSIHEFEVFGSAKATHFYGDGSNLTNLPSSTDSTKLPLAGGTLTGNTTLNDNVELLFGSNDDVSIKFDTADLITTIPSGSAFMIGTNGGTPNDNSGKADFVVAVNANPQISLYSGQVQVGSTDRNWKSKFYYDVSTKLAAWNTDLQIFTQGSSGATAKNIIIRPQAVDGATTTVATFNGDTGSTFAKNVTVGGASGSSGNAFAVNRGSDGAAAFRVQNSGEVVTDANYFYAAASGTSLYVQNTAVFRGAIINDGGDVTFSDSLMPSADSTYNLGSNAVKWAEGHFDHVYVGETGNNPRIDIYTEDETANIADSFADSTTDKSYIYFNGGTSSNDPG